MGNIDYTRRRPVLIRHGSKDKKRAQKAKRQQPRLIEANLISWDDLNLLGIGTTFEKAHDYVSRKLSYMHPSRKRLSRLRHTKRASRVLLRSTSFPGLMQV